MDGLGSRLPVNGLVTNDDVLLRSIVVVVVKVHHPGGGAAIKIILHLRSIDFTLNPTVRPLLLLLLNLPGCHFGVRGTMIFRIRTGTFCY